MTEYKFKFPERLDDETAKRITQEALNPRDANPPANLSYDEMLRRTREFCMENSEAMAAAFFPEEYYKRKNVFENNLIIK